MTDKIINDTNLLNPLKLKPNIDDMDLTKNVVGLNELNEKIEVDVVTEKPFTIFLNSQEIVTTMSLGDMPKELAVGYLLNQNMLNKKDVIEEIDYDDELDVVVIRTKRKTNYEKKLTKKIRTSGCAVGTVYGDMMETDYSGSEEYRDWKEYRHNLRNIFRVFAGYNATVITRKGVRGFLYVCDIKEYCRYLMQEDNVTMDQFLISM